ncbi:MAG: membrane protein insertase YidC [Clostridia bacterium]|nr:membrane protein insertase YidC [Clostridia bacterium]
MKHMKMMKRVALLVLCALLLVGTLTACAGGTSYDSEYKAEYGEENCRTYFVTILKQGATETEKAREMFIAASRGYNMSAEGFDDANLVVDPEAVVVLDQNGAEIAKVSMAGAKAAMQTIKPTKTEEKFNALLENMTAEDVLAVVSRMSEEVVTDGNAFPGVILEWIGAFLRLLTNITGGYYVWALFFFAVIIEIALLYFGVKQQKMSQKQARLRPKEMAIRKKYAGRNDQKSQQALQQELQRFYQEEGVSMFGGCLPLLIQMPIVIALYNIVINPLRYVLGKGEALSNALFKFASTSRAAGGLGMSVSDSGRGTIELLSQIEDPNKLAAIKDFAWFSNGGDVANELADVAGNLPNFSLFGLNTGLTPGFQPPYLLLLIPLLTFVAYFVSMKFTRKFSYQPAMAQNNQQMGCSNNMMDITMPLMSVYITFITPAAVGIYWIFKCLIGMLKQYLLHKAMPMPVFTEEDYKRAEREMKGKLRPEERAPLAGRPTGVKRSLHSIDDEDELPARVRQRDDGEEEDSIYERRKKEQQQRLAEDTARRLEQAQMKADRKNNKKK